MLNPCNQIALDYWKHTPVNPTAISAICSELDKKRLFLRVDFKPGEPTHATVSTAVQTTGQGHAPTVVNFFRLVSNYNLEAPLDGTIYIWLEDGMWRDLNSEVRWTMPCFSFGRHIHDYQSFLMPDPAFIESNAYADDKPAIDRAVKELPWHDKEETLFWRGAGSNRELPRDNWTDAQRVRFCLAAKEIPGIDAFISKVVDFGGRPSETGLHDLGIVSEYVHFPEFLRFKYLADIDGMCCAWMSLFFKLYSNSTVFKMDSEYVQWYHHLLKPWHEYIPLRDDLKDLQDLLDWAKAHDSLCQDIALNGRACVSQLNVTDAVAETYHLLHSLFTQQKALQNS